MRAIVIGITAAAAAACASPPQATTSQVSEPSAIDGDCNQSRGAPTSAGGGWSDDFIEQQWEQFSEIHFVATPTEASQQPIDAVIGFANGPASRFTDLGPIVRFNPDGYIDARNGSAYAADAPVPYVAAGGIYDFELSIDFVHHTYTAAVATPADPTRRIYVANNYAFRTEQATMPRADTVAREVDSPTGSIAVCGYAASANCMDASPPNWTTTPFRAQSGAFHLEVDAHAHGTGTDAVVGLAAGPPGGFTDLAAIFRFNPYGHMDVRDGGAYTADVDLTWTPDETYRVAFDVDVATHRYSVTVTPIGGQPVRIATDYAFRTEQAGVGSLAAVGQFVDSPYGSVETCHLLETY